MKNRRIAIPGFNNKNYCINAYLIKITKEFSDEFYHKKVSEVKMEN